MSRASRAQIGFPCRVGEGVALAQRGGVVGAHAAAGVVVGELPGGGGQAAGVVDLEDLVLQVEHAAGDVVAAELQAGGVDGLDPGCPVGAGVEAVGGDRGARRVVGEPAQATPGTAAAGRRVELQGEAGRGGRVDGVGVAREVPSPSDLKRQSMASSGWVCTVTSTSCGRSARSRRLRRSRWCLGDAVSWDSPEGNLAGSSSLRWWPWWSDPAPGPHRAGRMGWSG